MAAAFSAVRYYEPEKSFYFCHAPQRYIFFVRLSTHSAPFFIRLCFVFLQAHTRCTLQWILNASFAVHAGSFVWRLLSSSVVMRRRVKEGSAQPESPFLRVWSTACDCVECARSVCVVWAATCNTMSDLRPYIGAMNFDPKYMTDTAWSVRVAAHEIAHALGFSQESMREKSLVKKPEGIVRGTHRRMVAGKHV
ncbi:surface protease GP63 [Trypanosoma cruzi]|nr:surface protease GP63 [Trypanosoma cruzi]